MIGGPLFYLKQTFWPFGLSAFYPETRTLNVPFVAAGIVLVGAMAWAVLRWFRTRGRLAGILAFAVVWLYIGLLPMLGFVKVGIQEHADRYTYWVGCGAAVVVALLAVWLKPRREAVLGALKADPEREPWPVLRRHLINTVLVLAVVLGGLSYGRMGYWRDTVTLFRDAVSKSWEPEAGKVLAALLRDENLGGGAEEGEWWVRMCATRNPSPYADFVLAEYLLTSPRTISQTGDERKCVHAEAEMLLRNTLRTNPRNERVRKLLEDLERFKEGKGG